MGQRALDMLGPVMHILIAPQEQASFMVKKVCITKSVVFGLLKEQPNGILEPLPEDRQVYKDGTIFRMLDFRAFCMVAMHAYMELSSDAQELMHHLHDIVNFLDYNIPFFSSGASAKRGGLPSSECKPWLALKNSLQEGNVQPLALVLRNAGQQDGTRGKRKAPKLDRVDWYMREVGSLTGTCARWVH